MTLLYFTATGNNLYISKRIGGKLCSIPKMIKSKNYSFSDDKIGLVFPIYTLCVPPIIEDFLKKVKLQSDYIFAVMSYGKVPGGAASHLVDIGNRNGIDFSYINIIKMVDNYLPVYYMEKQIATEPKKHIEENLERIITDINGKKEYIHRDSILSKSITKRLMKATSNRTVGLSKGFFIDDGCNHCGTCVKVCPVDNVSLQGEKPEFKDHCVNCLACTHACPKNVIRLSSEKSKVRFRNQHIEIREIIDANE